jgi:hypothetical protein
MRCVFSYSKNDSFHIQIQHAVVFVTKWLETVLLKLNGLKSQKSDYKLEVSVSAKRTSSSSHRMTWLKNC